MVSDQWVVLELTAKADGEDPDLIRRSIAYMIRGAEVFIPAITTQVGGDRVVHYLVEGYAFIRHRHPDEVYSKLDDTKYVSNVVRVVLRTGANGRPVRQLATIKTEDIERMKKQIHAETDQGIGVDDLVLITSGAYKQIEAEVISDIPEEDKVQVRVLLRSKDTIVSLPRSFLKLVRKSTNGAGRNGLEPNLSEFLSWLSRSKRLVQDLSTVDHRVTMGRVLFGYGSLLRAEDWVLLLDRGGRFLRTMTSNRLDIQPVHLQGGMVSRLNGWVADLARGSSFLRTVLGAPFEHGSIQVQWDKFARLNRWVSRCRSLVYQISVPDLRPHAIEDRWLRMLSLESYLDQLGDIDRVLDKVEEEILMQQLEGTQNIIVDGLNLVYRCYYAPGMSELKSSSGQPTGAIYGFLRVLTSLLKKMPGASIYVAWDGSNHRRKALYDGYKANRQGSGNLDQVDILKSILPFLGVTQVVNINEEADDVIASLVRGELLGQRNVILSTDQDLLQLVSPTTRLLFPAQGKRQETVCDIAYLKDSWGVSADRIVPLRALLGDNSDNIPGVPTVPETILRSLLQTYGTIDGIFASSLAGLTKKRYNCIRGAEAQVRLNLELMMLQDVLIEKVVPLPNVSSVVRILTELDIHPDPIVTHFFQGVTLEAS